MIRPTEPLYCQTPSGIGGWHKINVALARSAGAGQYEISLGKEQLPWQRLKAAPSGSPPGPLWHEWGSAVEERDRATRGLVNQWLESATTEGSPSP